MDGTTLCPHCNTRLRIAAAQMEAHHGMVRCGHCLQAFDARPGFIPDEPGPQLELPMLNGPAPETAPLAAGAEHHETLDLAKILAEAPGDGHPDKLDIFGDEALQTMTLAERVAIVPGGMGEYSRASRKRRWPWITGSFLLAILLLAQAAYLFRVELAARLPGLKPALISYCKLLACNVPLPQHADLMNLESSDLETDPAHEDRITLNALLRNRAAYAQAFPNLELTLNDSNDKALARRVFRPSDYLPSTESEPAGLLPNRELTVKLRLELTGIKPTGYRLALYYP